MKCARLLVSGLVSGFLLAARPALLPAQSAEDYETARRNQEQVDFYRRQVGEAHRELTEALEVAVGGKVGEFEKWKALETRVNRYEQVFGDILPEIDRCVRNIIATLPNGQLPTLSVPDPFISRLVPVRERIEEIRRAEIDLGAQVAALDKAIQDLNQAILADTNEAYQKAVETIIPDLQGVATTGTTVVAFTWWLGPPGVAIGFTVAAGIGMVRAALQSTAALNDLAARTKQNLATIENLKKGRAEMQAVRDSYQPALEEMRMIEQALKMHSEKFEALRGRVEGVVNGWRGLSAETVEKKRREAEDAFEENRRREAARQAVNLSHNYYIVGFGAPVPAPIQPSEYLDEADGLLAPVRSAYEAVLDGAEPGVFEEAHERVIEQVERLAREVAAAREQAENAFNTAASQYYVTARSLGKSYDEQCARIWNSGGTFEQKISALQATYNAYAAALQAAASQVRPSATALGAARRETTRRYLVTGSVQGGAGSLRAMLQNHSWLLRLGYFTEYDAWRARIALADTDYQSALGLLPDAWELESIRRRVAGLGESVRAGLLGERWWEPLQTPAQWQVELRFFLERVEKLEARWVANRPMAEWALNEANSLRAEALPELVKLAEFPLTGWMAYEIRLSPEWLESVFAEMVPEKRSEPDFPGWKSAIRQQADELREWAEWVDLYAGRLEVSVFRIDSRSHPLVGFGVYGLPPAVTDLLAGKPVWSSLSSKINQAVPGEFRVAWWSSRPLDGWDRMGVRIRLLYATGAIYNRCREAFRLYEQASRWGGFVPANAAELEKLESAWQGLSKLVSEYESLAGPDRAGIDELATGIAGFKEPVYAAYSAMPAWLRRFVSDRHLRFHNGVSRLERFLYEYRQETAPLEQVESVSWLDDIFERYRKDLARWEELERRRAEEDERRRRAEEEAERLAREKERLEAEARARLVAAVESFYAGFARVYERRDAAALAAMLEQGWTAADGTTLSDLRETLENSFRIFDEVSCRITGLRVGFEEDGSARADYGIEIVGRINRARIRHEEKSEVSEILRQDGGRLRIMRTLAGSYWQAP